MGIFTDLRSRNDLDRLTLLTEDILYVRDVRLCQFRRSHRNIVNVVGSLGEEVLNRVTGNLDASEGVDDRAFGLDNEGVRFLSAAFSSNFSGYLGIKSTARTNHIEFEFLYFLFEDEFHVNRIIGLLFIINLLRRELVVRYAVIEDVCQISIIRSLSRVGDCIVADAVDSDTHVSIGQRFHDSVSLLQALTLEANVVTIRCIIIKRTCIEIFDTLQFTCNSCQLVVARRNRFLTLDGINPGVHAIFGGNGDNTIDERNRLEVRLLGERYNRHVLAFQRELMLRNIQSLLAGGNACQCSIGAQVHIKLNSIGFDAAGF